MINNFTVQECGYYISSQNFKQRITPLRTTACYEFELYTTCAGVSVVDENHIPHKKGNILICRPGQHRQSIEAFENHYVHFHCHNKEFEQKYLNALPIVISCHDMVGYSKVFESIAKAFTSKYSGYELFIDAKISELISMLYNLATTYMATDNRYAKYESEIYSAARFMQNNFGRHLKLETVAKAANLSPSYFHNIFKQITGITPHRYLTEIRINRACYLLLNTEKTISEIAELCGFESQIYLNYILKKELNMTPKYYRESNHSTII